MLKVLKKPHIQIWVALILLFFATRLTNILLLPLFTDESIYIYWAKVIETTHSQWFISLTDGKPPVLIWMIAVFLGIFPSDGYLLAGRLPSVITGFIALLAIIKTGEELFSRRVGMLAGLFYIIFPMTLFYDRMALFDGMLTSMLLTSVYFAVRTGKNRLMRDGILWGFSLGLAFLAKPTALLFLPLTVLAAFMMLPFKAWRKYYKRLGLLSLIAVGIGEGINNLQRISSAYPAMIRKNEQFQQPISELLRHPFALLSGNLEGFLGWTIAYYTLPFFLFGIASFIFGLLKKSKEMLLLLVLWLVPFIGLATVGREVFPRYILIVVPYFLLSASYAASYLLSLPSKKHRIPALMGLMLLVAPLLWFDYKLLTNPQNAPFPVTDRNQYILEHPSGYGLEETFAFIRDASKEGKVTLVTQGTFGLYPYAYYLEFWGDPNVSILPKWPLDTLDEEIMESSQSSTLYIVLKEHESIPQQLPLTEVFRAEKPGGKYPIIITELSPQ